MAEHNDLGEWGEDYAAHYLKANGYLIMERDWKYGRSKSDIDIICKTPDAKTVAFVEVKTRAEEQITSPEDAVNVQKVRRIGKAADHYVKMCDIVEDLRFDIITIIGRKDSGNIQINHIENAFNPLLI